MKRYQASVPHVVIGMAAMAMTTVTLAMAVVIPATFSDCGTRDVPTLAAATVVAPVVTEVSISPARIDVVGFRASGLPSDVAGNTSAAQPQGRG